MKRPIVTGGCAVALLFIAGGCSMTTTHDATGDGSTHSLIKDGRGTIDFRHVPSREDIGMGRDGFVSYPAKTGGKPVELTLRFPRGEVTRHFFEMDAGTNYAFRRDENPHHAPKAYDFFQRAATLQEAQRVLRADSTALGLRAADIDTVTGEGTSSIPGLIEGRLAVNAEVRAREDRGLNIIYSVAIDEYHNPAIDEVVHDGAMSLDVRTRPTREALGFLPHYDESSIQPEPGKSIALTVLTPKGQIAIPATAVLSNGTAADPTVTSIQSLPALQPGIETIQQAASALGFDGEAAVAFVDAAKGEMKEKEYTFESSAYRGSFRIQVTHGEGAKRLALRLILNYV